MRLIEQYGKPLKNDVIVFHIFMQITLSSLCTQYALIFDTFLLFIFQKIQIKTIFVPGK